MITKIKIIGAGPTGAILSLALTSAGHEVTIVDSKDAKKLLQKNRAYALTHSSRILLQKLDLWEDLNHYLYPFNSLQIEDREINYKISCSQTDMPINKSRNRDIGWIIEHKYLMKVLLDRMKKVGSIDSLLGVNNKFEDKKFDLLIGCDGFNSVVRRKLDIMTFSLRYRQSCLTAKVLIRSNIKSKAYEIFRNEGPLAVLPISDDIYQIVWTAPIQSNEERLSLSQSQFLDRLASVLPEGYEPDMLIDAPTVYPLGLSIPLSLHKGKHLLVGESAHMCHPVGGQGLNLCWRDVNSLMSLMMKVRDEELSIAKLPIIYSLRRLPDIFLLGFFTHFTVKLFSNRFPVLKLFRYLALYFLRYFRIFRVLLMRLMSYGPMIVL